MAIAQAEKNTQAEQEAEIRETLARASKTFQKLETLTRLENEFNAELKALRADVVYLLNARENLDKLKREAELAIAQAERDASSRLQNVERGHSAIIEGLNKKEVLLNQKIAELEKRDLAVSQERQKYELLNAELERKVAGVDRVTAKK